MSLQTFKNLPIERQKEIIELSLKEFAFKEYESASLSAIIKNLNLAKGSFYRYFKNKKSLYLYLLNYVIEFRLQNEKNILDGSIVNFFDMMVENFAAKIRFDIEYPLFGAFLHNVMQEKNSEELGDIQAEIKNKILKMILFLMEKSGYKNTFRTDIPKDIIAYSIMQIQLGIYEFISWKYGVNFKEQFEKGQKISKLSNDDILTVAKAFINVLKKGLEKKAE